MDKKLIRKFDKENMFDVLNGFPLQVKEALKIAGKHDLKSFKKKGIGNIIISGLGGSAIGGDLFRSYTQYDIKVPVMVNRNYTLPEFADKKTLVIISSYSGNTEETIAAYKQAIEAKCKIICITSGGEIKKIAKKNKHHCLIIPGGLQPRCALGYSFFSLLTVFVKLGLVNDRKEEIKETLKILEEGREEFTNLNPENNVALKVAIEIRNKLPVVYSSSDVLDVVNLRWRGQISENAKILAYGNVYPEMNHNELVGWKLNADILKKIVVIFLKDPADNERVKLRMNITLDIIKEYAGNIITLESNARGKLARIFDLIYLGDWVSFYLAALNEVNPTPVKAISYLKTELEKIAIK
ncbi:MAG: bifunctional phosphoglucose/phosphomannose isomerase [Ignavibacteriae bacterium]|nr:bifunctional phosphoglucose/phosphomannose isomerase [Ignavibacteriota bacterium]